MFLPIIDIFVANCEAMKGNTSVSLGAHFEGFIDGRIAEGRYKNASEVIRDALRRLEDEGKLRQKKIQVLRIAIQEGLDNGIIEKYCM
jgi:antitoxin ParD1/3/4